jgi:hypothetical protein
MPQSPFYSQQILQNIGRIWHNIGQLRFYALGAPAKRAYIREMSRAAKENWHAAQLLMRLP